jgi:hypothetical protein
VTNPQLYVIRGPSRDLTKSICKTASNLNSQVAFCETEKPADGVYTIVLRRGDGTGTADFQLVVSVF